MHVFEEGYLVHFSKGFNWREGVPFKDQPEASQHADYMGRLRAGGRSMKAIPLADASGSVLIFQAQTFEEALQIVEGDPMVSAEVMRGDLYELKAVLPPLRYPHPGATENPGGEGD